MKYKSKKNTDNSTKNNNVKYYNTASSKRPKSAKGVGNYINTSKYKQSDTPASSVYKNSMHKGSISTKYNISKKKNGTSSHLRKNPSIKTISTKSKKDNNGSVYK